MSGGVVTQFVCCTGDKVNAPSPRLLHLTQLPLEAGHSHGREIRTAVDLTQGCDLRQNQSRADTDLQYSSRAEFTNTVHCQVTPFTHLIQRDRISGVAASPAGEVVFGPQARSGPLILCPVAIQIVVDVTPAMYCVALVSHAEVA